MKFPFPESVLSAAFYTIKNVNIIADHFLNFLIIDLQTADNSFIYSTFGYLAELSGSLLMKI